MDAFWAAPPISRYAPAHRVPTAFNSCSDTSLRTITAATVVLSVCTHFGLLNFYYVAFIPRFLFQLWIPQLWRLVTPFMITSPKLGLIMDPYFLFTYSKALEVDSARFSNPGDYIVFLVFACSIILVSWLFPHHSMVTASPINHSPFSLPPSLPYNNKNLEISARSAQIPS